MDQKNNLQHTIITIDSTLRDGEQAAGVYFTQDDKLRIARALSEAGVTILDAGFPIVSKEEKESFRAVAQAGLQARIFATVRPDIDEITQAKELGAVGVFLFFPISLILSGLFRSMCVDLFQNILQQDFAVQRMPGRPRLRRQQPLLPRLWRIYDLRGYNLGMDFFDSFIEAVEKPRTPRFLRYRVLSGILFLQYLRHPRQHIVVGIMHRHHLWRVRIRDIEYAKAAIARRTDGVAAANIPPALTCS